ncbi:MAG: F0F1 ATP synthase subunit gamma [Pseudomonadota bacterium]|nr:F0F1 ATP synthase subunit gamma [Pseudomonadota bacterium]
MASGKEIRTQIASVKSTQKITNAQQMVAVSKMRRATERMAAGKPYSDRVRAVVGHLANATPEYQHRYMVEREVRRVGYVVVSSDRGLCGGLNINLFKTVLKELQGWDRDGVAADYCTIGSKGQAFFQGLKGDIIASTQRLGDTPEVTDLIGTIKVMLEAYTEGQIDRVYLASNSFVNTMTQVPTLRQLLPLEPVEDESMKHQWDYLYEPDARELLDGLLERYIESQVYQAVVENIACEQAARMVAMKSATENAEELIEDLQLKFNKIRQAGITQELSEIVGGAAAV